MHFGTEASWWLATGLYPVRAEFNSLVFHGDERSDKCPIVKAEVSIPRFSGSAGASPHGSVSQRQRTPIQNRSSVGSNPTGATMGRSKNTHSRRVCSWKVRHLAEEAATIHAVSLCQDKGKPIGHWRAYRCPHCEGWHVGRLPGPTKGYAIREEPRDPTLYDAIGRRAYIAGALENHRRYLTREKYLNTLTRRVYWQQWRSATGKVEGRFLRQKKEQTSDA